MFRTILTYLLLTSVLLQPFSREMVVMSFELNKEYIIKNLCENRARPQLHCDGHCFLAKKLNAEQERADKETAERVNNLPTVVWYYQHTPSFQFGAAAASTDSELLSAYLFPAYTAPLTGLLQPPQA